MDSPGGLEERKKGGDKAEEGQGISIMHCEFSIDEKFALFAPFFSADSLKRKNASFRH